MIRILIILCLGLSSCDLSQFEEIKTVTIGYDKFLIETASDSCEYMVIRNPANYQKPTYQHYVQCSWCKKHKK